MGNCPTCSCTLPILSYSLIAIDACFLVQYTGVKSAYPSETARATFLVFEASPEEVPVSGLPINHSNGCMIGTRCITVTARQHLGHTSCRMLVVQRLSHTFRQALSCEFHSLVGGCRKACMNQDAICNSLADIFNGLQEGREMVEVAPTLFQKSQTTSSVPLPRGRRDYDSRASPRSPGNLRR